MHAKLKRLNYVYVVSASPIGVRVRLWGRVREKLNVRLGYGHVREIKSNEMKSKSVV